MPYFKHIMFIWFWGKFPVAMAIAGCVADGYITFDTKPHAAQLNSAFQKFEVPSGKLT